LLLHAIKVLFLALSVTFSFFVCASNISRTAEWICTKFTGKTCLVPRSNESECQGQRSKVKVIRGQNREPASSPFTVHCKVCAICCRFRTAADETIPWPPGGEGSARWREASAACVRCMFGETSLALVYWNFCCYRVSGSKTSDFGHGVKVYTRLLLWYSDSYTHPRCSLRPMYLSCCFIKGVVPC